LEDRLGYDVAIAVQEGPKDVGTIVEGALTGNDGKKAKRQAPLTGPIGDEIAEILGDLDFKNKRQLLPEQLVDRLGYDVATGVEELPGDAVDVVEGALSGKDGKKAKRQAPLTGPIGDEIAEILGDLDFKN
jgi:hypothetical protein